MKRVCSICVRGGSKGLKDKNLRPLLGKPLLAYSIEQAVAANLFDTIAVSSDSPALLDEATKAGASVLIERPSELASDSAPKLAAIRHCIDSVESKLGVSFETCVDLDATSPLRSVEDILAVVSLLESSDSISNVITGMPSRRSPYFNLVEVDSGGVVRLSKPIQGGVARRQDSPPCYDMNASIYAWRREALSSADTLFSSGTRLHVMPEDRSWDIDSELDFAIVEMFLKRARSEVAE